MTAARLSDPFLVVPTRDPLASRLAAGDRDALAEAYDLHHMAVRAFARRLVGDADVAEDLVHEAFLRLPDAARRFRQDASLRTFLISIAVNAARHHVRAAQRRRGATARFGEERSGEGASGQDEELSRKHLSKVLSRALDRLPLEQRVAFVLFAVEERSAAEVAQIAGVPEATVRTRVFHAKRKLRELLSVAELV